MTGNDYVDDLPRGDVVAAVGWSGDAVQLQPDNPAIQFRVPDEGCILWSDDMVIPVGAPNPGAAYEFLNFIYEPEIAAQIAGYVNYTTPVARRPEVFEKQGSDLANERSDLPVARSSSRTARRSRSSTATTRPRSKRRGQTSSRAE